MQLFGNPKVCIPLPLCVPLPHGLIGPDPATVPIPHPLLDIWYGNKWLREQDRFPPPMPFMVVQKNYGRLLHRPRRKVLDGKTSVFKPKTKHMPIPVIVMSPAVDSMKLSSSARRLVLQFSLPSRCLSRVPFYRGGDGYQ